ncbi:MAG: DUF6868 family protein [Pseudomonadota bacterium]
MTLATLTTVFGWATLINLAILAVAAIAVVGMREFLVKTHGRMFDMDEAALSRAYFGWLANYKILTVIFFLVPYIALRIAG